MTPRLFIVGLGMVTPVGHDAVQTCTALRAGIGAFRQQEGILDSRGYAVVAATLPFDEPSVAERLLRATLIAVAEALAEAEPTTGSTLYVATVGPEAQRPGYSLDTGRLADGIRRLFGRRRDVHFAHHPCGHAGGALALRQIEAWLARDPGCLALLIGADSLCEVATLGYLDQSGRLKTPQRARGLIPGEAAVAIAVRAGRAGSRTPVHSMECPILGIGHSIETCRVVDDTPCLGDGLTAALRMAMGRIEWDCEAMGPTYCDLNGEDYRSNEWLLVACRTAVPDSLHHPADCIGDVGAASFLLLLGLAASGQRREGEEHALIWASSDFGARGAACIGCLV